MVYIPSSVAVHSFACCYDYVAMEKWINNQLFGNDDESKKKKVNTSSVSQNDVPECVSYISG